MDLLTTPYVFDVRNAEAMTRAGADIIVAHMGLTTNGRIGVTTSKMLAECVPAIRAIVDAARSVNDQIMVLCQGGPIATPEDAQYTLERVDGLLDSTGPVPWNAGRRKWP